MKKYNKILEAINKGINFALDDFDNNELIGLQTLTIKDKHYTKEYLHACDIAVDMGLPSGTWWCKYNLGVNPDILYDKLDWYGNYYAWGINNANDYFTWGSYDYSEWATRQSSFSTSFSRDEYLIVKFLKYCYDTNATASTCDKPDNKMIMDLEDDAAYKKDHYTCIPTKEQFDELRKNCKLEVVKHYNHISDLNGFLFTSKINGNQLFFPCTGYMNEDKICRDRTQGFYWANNLSERYQSCGGCMLLNTRLRTVGLGDYRRDLGCSIRPVIKW